jgi:hypothetical protein
VAHDRCADCHEDPHQGQFLSRATGSDCSSCHNQVSYKPALFDRAAHARAAFPLEGKHSELLCTDCHQPIGHTTVYITRRLICSACHNDQHAGQFAAAPWSNRCDACHVPAGFNLPTFMAARHSETKFALTGKHATVACDKCHQPLAQQPAAIVPVAASVGRKPSYEPARQYRFTSENCSACHNDPHQTKLSCETCHTTEAWEAVKAFDHATTQFPLNGSHQKASCADCHINRAALTAGTPPKALQFASHATECMSCHAAKDPHAGQFQTGHAEDCATCHVATEWKTVTFNHDQARFALDVAHRKVGCEKCHKEQKTTMGATIRVYRGTPTECVNCH